MAYAATYTGGQDVYYTRIGDYDCNANGIADQIDLASGESRDCDGDSIPDECETRADWNLSGSVSSADITAYLASWFADVSFQTGAADYDDSGVTNSADITAFLADWFAGLVGC
ncbi:MAG: hypothetical protein H7Y88_12165 [Phycisphaerales bacterium]|nr:hypothetical protein [Phycisphaerales bacterium]